MTTLVLERYHPFAGWRCDCSWQGCLCLDMVNHFTKRSFFVQFSSQLGQIEKSAVLQFFIWLSISLTVYQREKWFSEHYDGITNKNRKLSNKFCANMLNWGLKSFTKPAIISITVWSARNRGDWSTGIAMYRWEFSPALFLSPKLTRSDSYL